METELIKELAGSVNNVASASFQSGKEHTERPLLARIKKLEDVLNLILNENFSGQSTLSSYVKREANQALQADKDG